MNVGLWGDMSLFKNEYTQLTMSSFELQLKETGLNCCDAAQFTV